MVYHLVSAQSSARMTSPHSQGTMALLAASHGLGSCLSQVGSYYLGSLESVYCCFGEGGESIHRFVGDLEQLLGGSTDNKNWTPTWRPPRHRNGEQIKLTGRHERTVLKLLLQSSRRARKSQGQKLYCHVITRDTHASVTKTNSKYR